MSLYSGATPGGFNQSGGSYYIVTSQIAGSNILYYTGQAGSGGATTVGTFSNITGSGVGETNAATYSSLFGTGKLIKDMGKTVVSAGRAFRKFQAVLAASSSTGGVTGGASTSTQPGYFTAYLEVAAPNAGGVPAAVNPIARYA